MPATHDLSHAEATKAFRAFQDEVGPQATVSVSINTGRYSQSRDSLTAMVWPKGVGAYGGDTIQVDADTYVDLLATLRSEWAKHGDDHTAKTIRDMALKIISITADEGCCSELSLARAFSAAEVKTYGDRACDEATRISGNRPFSIVRAASDVEAA